MNFLQITLDLLGGFGLTCLLFFLTLLFAVPLGLGLSFCSMSNCRPVKTASRVFIWIIRGIPLMLLVCMIYYLPGLLGTGTFNIFDKLDRYFTQLEMCGILQSCRGLLLGQFSDGASPEDLDALFERVAAKVNGPVISNLPFGHTYPLASL